MKSNFRWNTKIGINKTRIFDIIDWMIYSHFSEKGALLQFDRIDRLQCAHLSMK